MSRGWQVEHSTVLIDDVFSQFLPSVFNILGYVARSSILEVYKILWKRASRYLTIIVMATLN